MARISPVEAQPGRAALTTRQRDVAALVARGSTNQQIAAELVISHGTVANHVQQILRRTGLASRAARRRDADRQNTSVGLDLGEFYARLLALSCPSTQREEAPLGMFETGPPSRAILASIERPNLSVHPLDARGQPWLLEAGDWRAVLRYLPPRRYPPADSVAHVQWLHRFLDRLAPLQVATPRPLRELGGASIAVADGALWELLTYVPGRPLGRDPHVPLQSAGGMLASFHLASREVSTPEQRPGALPLEDCCPTSAGALVSEFQRDLADLDQASVEWCVLHADCTVSNMLVSGEPPTATGMIDFALASSDHPKLTSASPSG